MQKIYLLLRNNIQTGPFTIDELFQQQLKPGDLIWIEGKSTAWAHPSDFDLAFHHEEVKPEPALQPIATADDAMVSKMRTGNLVPEKDLEKRAEEIKRHVLETVQQPNYHKTSYNHQPVHERKTIYQDNNKIHLTYHKAKNSLDPSHVVAGMLVLLLIVVGWYNGWSPINEQKGATNAVAIPGMPEMKTSVAESTSQPVQISTEQANAAMAATAIDSVNAQQPVAKPQKRPENIAIVTKAPEKLDTQATNTEAKPQVDETAATVTNNQSQPTEQKTTDIVVAAPKQEVVATEDEGKKKKFGQVIAGIFKKKKKDDSKQVEEEKTTTDNNN